MSAGPITDEAEAWLVLAELIEGGRTLPNWCDNEEACEGLCDVTYSALWFGLIGRDTYEAMDGRLRAALESRAYLAPIGRWVPRVKWCRRFAAAVLKEREAAR